MNQEAQFLIKRLGLEKHEEGGYFRQTYESKQQVQVHGYEGKRHIATAIYYLVLGDVADPFHRMKSDELWHFYYGSSLMVYSIDQKGKLTKISMGQDIRKGEAVQVVFEGGTWFGAEVKDPKSYSLIGCTVSPGFDRIDFEFAKRVDLLKHYPQYTSVIVRLTR